eukprot:TRINITY_DN48782_c0_g1_i1.p1 TRINITY_DN48782_c0_g1~~TRINITY_DN48782_c0_g1_i1.p1  ORF type:complete len:310 (+),score=58.59 TRINITY_DN48782_c0_g1_i1:185-1114(+)
MTTSAQQEAEELRRALAEVRAETKSCEIALEVELDVARKKKVQDEQRALKRELSLLEKQRDQDVSLTVALQAELQNLRQGNDQLAQSLERRFLSRSQSSEDVLSWLTRALRCPSRSGGGRRGPPRSRISLVWDLVCKIPGTLAVLCTPDTFIMQAFSPMARDRWSAKLIGQGLKELATEPATMDLLEQVCRRCVESTSKEKAMETPCLGLKTIRGDMMDCNMIVNYLPPSQNMPGALLIVFEDLATLEDYLCDSDVTLNQPMQRQGRIASKDLPLGRGGKYSNPSSRHSAMTSVIGPDDSISQVGGSEG